MFMDSQLTIRPSEDSLLVLIKLREKMNNEDKIRNVWKNEPISWSNNNLKALYVGNLLRLRTEKWNIWRQLFYTSFEWSPFHAVSLKGFPISRGLLFEAATQ